MTTCQFVLTHMYIHMRAYLECGLKFSTLTTTKKKKKKKPFHFASKHSLKSIGKRLWQETPLKCDSNHSETTCMFLTHFTSPTPPVNSAEIMTHSFTDRWLAQGWNVFTRICESSWLFPEKSVPHISRLLHIKYKVIQVRAYHHPVATGRHNPYLQCHCSTVSDSLFQSGFLQETWETKQFLGNSDWSLFVFVFVSLSLSLSLTLSLSIYIYIYIDIHR